MNKKKTAEPGRRTGIGGFFRGLADALVKGDISVKLSFVIMGLGHARRGKYLHGLLLLAIEASFILFCGTFAAENLSKFGTLGSVQMEMYFDPVLFTNVVNDYDHSFKILLYGIISIVLIVVFVCVWLGSVRDAYRLQLASERGERIGTLRDDLHDMVDAKFHRTLLALPVLGIVVFTIVPIIVMIAVAFTNYDQHHMPPNALFTWVGFENFRQLFTNSITATFGYSFGKILSWTLIWAVVATFTCYIGGILLALLINNRRTRWKKMWRTCFVVAMAVPQFVSLLLVRNFFADQGIMNTFCAADLMVIPRWIVTQFNPDATIASVSILDILKNIGLVPEYLTHVPFLTHKTWVKFMVIIINIWVGVPYLLLIATGVLMNIPQDLYEAATIDGANAFQKFRKITMPYMLFVTGPYLINSVVQNINNFNVIYLLTQDIYETSDQLLANSHAREPDLLVNWLFRLTNEYYNYKMASVIGIMVFIVCAVITLVAFNIVTRNNKEEAMM